jgi:hypothetical protein
MARTQLRLDSITGSMPALKPAVVVQGAEVAAFAAADVQDVLKGYAQAISNIHGITEFTAQVPGKFEHATSQFIGVLSASSDILGGRDMVLARDADVKGKLSVGSTAFVKSHITGSGDVVLNQVSGAKINVTGGKLSAAIMGGFEVGMSNLGSEAVSFKFAGAEKFSVSKVGDTAIKGTLDVDGQATLFGATVEDLSATDGALVFHNASRKLIDNSGLKFDGSDLVVPGLKDSSLTATHVVFAGTGGELTGESAMTYDASLDKLQVNGSYFGQDVSVSRDVTVGRDLTVTGDLLVQGATVTVNVGELVIEDKMITVASGAAGATLDGAGIQLGLGAEQAFAWNHAGTKWVASAKLASAKLQRTEVSAARIAGYDASGNLTSENLNNWVAGTLNQISVADDADGSITLSLPQSIHTDADVEFDSLKLGDNVADAGKALKIGAAGEVVAAAWNEFVAIEAGVGLELIQSGFKAEIGLAQSILTGSSPTFVGMTFSGLSSAPLQVSAGGVLQEMDLSTWISGTTHQVNVAQGGTDNHGLVISLPYAISDASNTELRGFTATSILGALNELAGGAGGGKGKWSEMLVADAAGGVHTFASGPNWSAAGFDMARVDIYLNGQMMKETADYALSSARTVTFTFPLKADDVVTARIC